MGLIRFSLAQADRVSAAALNRAYMAGMDEVPWPTRVVATDDGLIVDRPESESGCFYIPWKVEGFCEMTLSTASLMERSRPYLLEVELARGTLNRIRNQLANWEQAGLVIPDPIRKRLSEVTEVFSRAVTSQLDQQQAAKLASEVLAEGLSLTVALGAAYAQQALSMRHASGNKLVTLLGANLGEKPLETPVADHFTQTFNSAIVPMAWNQLVRDEGEYNWDLTEAQIKWCKANDMKICSGPLVSLDGANIPDWLVLWEEDLENLTEFIAQHVRSVVQRFRGRLHVWQAVSRVNSNTFLGLSRQDTMRLAIFIVETIREIDPQTPVVISFDQPWGDPKSSQDAELPVYLADTLARSNLGLAGVGLEMKIGYHPNGSSFRDVIEFSRQLDRWAMLGMPLLVSLVVPGGEGDDPHANSESLPHPDVWTVERQEEWVRDYVPILLGKQAVQGIMWDQLYDAHPHALPHGGLIDARAEAKPALGSLTAIRKAHLD